MCALLSHVNSKSGRVSPTVWGGFLGGTGLSTQGIIFASAEQELMQHSQMLYTSVYQKKHVTS